MESFAQNMLSEQVRSTPEPLEKVEDPEAIVPHGIESRELILVVEDKAYFSRAFRKQF